MYIHMSVCIGFQNHIQTEPNMHFNITCGGGFFWGFLEGGRGGAGGWGMHCLLTYYFLLIQNDKG